MQYKENQQYGHWDPYLECWLLQRILILNHQNSFKKNV